LPDLLGGDRVLALDDEGPAELHHHGLALARSAPPTRRRSASAVLRVEETLCVGARAVAAGARRMAHRAVACRPP
jgi:hypothetical protein